MAEVEPASSRVALKENWYCEESECSDLQEPLGRSSHTELEGSMTFFLHPRSTGACCQPSHSAGVSLVLNKAQQSILMISEECRVHNTAPGLIIKLGGPTFNPAESWRPRQKLPRITHHNSQRRTPEHPTLYNAVPQDQYRVVRAVVVTAEGQTDKCTPSIAIDRSCNCLLQVDTHHIQIHRPEALRFKDKKARKVCRQANRKARRHITHIVTAAAIEPYRCHSNFRSKDIRPGVGHMSAI